MPVLVPEISVSPGNVSRIHELEISCRARWKCVCVITIMDTVSYRDVSMDAGLLHDELEQGKADQTALMVCLLLFSIQES
jgi:hypothetical protein